MIMNLLDFTIIVPVCVVLFGVFVGYFGESLQKLTWVWHSQVFIEYLVTVLFISLVLYIHIKNTEVVNAMAPKEGLANINIDGGSVYVHILNISVNTVLVKALANVGVGWAIAGCMTPPTRIITYTPFPAIKFGTIVAGGAVAAVLFTATNAAISIVGIIVSDHNVMVLLELNLILHVIMLYLFLNLIMILLLDLVFKVDLEVLYVRKIIGKHFLCFGLRCINYSSNMDKFWIRVILILFVISFIGSLFISYFLLNNIDIISDIMSKQSTS